MKLDKRHIAKVGGKDYVLLSGLLDLAYGKGGLQSLTTEMLSNDTEQGRAVFRATATGDRGTCTGHGDASPANLSEMMMASYIRMAETRAICRALRFYLGIGMCARDELPGAAPPPKPQERKSGEEASCPKGTGWWVERNAWEAWLKGLAVVVEEQGLAMQIAEYMSVTEAASPYDAVCLWLASMRKPCPEEMSKDRAFKVLEWLNADGGERFGLWMGAHLERLAP